MLSYSFIVSNLNCRIVIFYPEGKSPSDTVNITNLITILNDISENTKKYDGNLFDSMLIEIYDKTLPDIPVTKTVCNGTLCYQELGIGNYAGLTSAWKKLIQLNNNSLGDLKAMSDCLSHEFGHYKQWFMGWGKRDTPSSKAFSDEWERLVIPIVNKNISEGYEQKVDIPEIPAENIRHFQGGRLTKDVYRGGKSFIDTINIQGMKDLYKIWKPATDYMNSFDNQLLCSIENIQFHYGQFENGTDKNSFEVWFYQKSLLLPIVNKWIKVDRLGFYEWKFTNNNWSWVLNRTF